MPFTREEFTRLVNLIAPVLPDREKRLSILSLAFFDAPLKQGVVSLDLPANTFTTNLLSHWHAHSESDLLTLLQVIQENEGGDMARGLAPFVEKLRIATTPAAPTYRLFISYRRKSWEFTHRLAADLKGKVNADVFVDYGGVDSSDFERSIMSHLRAADCVLVVVTEHTFTERIHQPGDWMRKEIAEALRLGKPTVLIAHEGRFPPPPEELPGDIRGITGRQGIRFFPDFWDAALTQLVAFIPKAIQNPPTPFVPEVPPLASAPPMAAKPPLPTEASAPKGHDYAASYEQAMSFYDAERFDEALPLLEQLAAADYRTRVILPLIGECRNLMVEQRQKVRYNEIAELARRTRTDSAKAAARAELEQFARDFPTYGDPEDLWTKLAPLGTRSVNVLPAPYAWVAIPRKRYSIAKYPLTNAQYRRFVEAGGYSEERWWTAAGWQAHEDNGWTQPHYWQDHPWNAADRPVVGVSWYEAVAYCKWLSEITGERIMVPTEDQWQYAAQGDDFREYPWGNEWDYKKCNNNVAPCDGSATTPVRLYEGKGDSPFGVVDMAGNVEEWCLTAYNTGHNDLDGTDNRVLRGGSWVRYETYYFRCDNREVQSPSSRNNEWGFRLALS